MSDTHTHTNTGHAAQNGQTSGSIPVEVVGTAEHAAESGAIATAEAVERAVPRGFQSKGLKIAAGVGATALGFDGIRRITSEDGSKLGGAVELAAAGGLAYKGLFAKVAEQAVGAAAHGRL